MESPTRPSVLPAAGGFPIALVVALAALGITDRLIWSYAPLLRFCARYAPLYSAKDYPMRTAAHVGLLPSDDEQPPILLLGSSQVYEGVECAPFERRFPGRTCENLGIAAGTPSDVLYLLGRADLRTRKRVTIMAFFQSTLHKGPKPAYTDLTTLRLLVRSGALFHMNPGEWLDVVDGELQTFSETLRMSASLKEVWRFVSRDPMAALRRQLPKPQLRLFLPRPRSELAAMMGKILDPEATPGRFTRLHELAIEAIISGEARRGNRLIVFDYPTHDGYETIVTPEANLHYRRLLDRLAARKEVTLVRRADLPQLQDSDFRDLVHVLPSGRAKISDGLAQILARTEAAPGP
jgi:hypothetical protein